MLPYDGTRELERVLEGLFADDDELDGIAVLNSPIDPMLSEDCCNYSYASYGC